MPIVQRLEGDIDTDEPLTCWGLSAGHRILQGMMLKPCSDLQYSRPPSLHLASGRAAIFSDHGEHLSDPEALRCRGWGLLAAS